MILGKRPRPRPRPPMRRTTSVMEFSAADLAAAAEASDDEGAHRSHERRREAEPRTVQRRSFSDFELAGTAQFLRVCDLCKRRVGPGLDTFIYRGEIAFCSLERRQHQMNLDDQKEKCSVTSLKTDASPATAGSEASSHGGTVAAA
ncbi:FCS-Like Zinc finger 5-like [Phoenix dactylifera]|uniref:FCS-Like Zinc finger 5-like n=1 Tax=Phoenix dactylifera TaxID=42345 RepID=A0A8B7BNG2_PHODC|nr:FCS-Like Zinc finger 5-like [Phoenix dactylifera]